MASNVNRSTVAELKRKLAAARHVTIGLAPPAARDVLSAYRFCASADDAATWEQWAIERLVAMADARQPVVGDEPFGPPRAPCPLCRAGSTKWGFAVPSGLEMHLEGSHRGERCPVFATALDACLDSVRELAVAKAKVPPTHFKPPPWREGPGSVAFEEACRG